MSEEMRPDVDHLAIVAAQARLPVFGIGHRGLPQSSQKSILERLRASTLDSLRYGACREEFGDQTREYWRCIHSRGREANCEFVAY